MSLVKIYQRTARASPRQGSTSKAATASCFSHACLRFLPVLRRSFRVTDANTCEEHGLELMIIRSKEQYQHLYGHFEPYIELLLGVYADPKPTVWSATSGCIMQDSRDQSNGLCLAYDPMLRMQCVYVSRTPNLLTKQPHPSYPIHSHSLPGLGCC